MKVGSIQISMGAKGILGLGPFGSEVESIWAGCDPDICKFIQQLCQFCRKPHQPITTPTNAVEESETPVVESTTTPTKPTTTTPTTTPTEVDGSPTALLKKWCSDDKYTDISSGTSNDTDGAEQTSPDSQYQHSTTVSHRTKNAFQRRLRHSLRQEKGILFARVTADWG